MSAAVTVSFRAGSRFNPGRRSKSFKIDADSTPIGNKALVDVVVPAVVSTPPLPSVASIAVLTIDQYLELMIGIIHNMHIGIRWVPLPDRVRLVTLPDQSPEQIRQYIRTLAKKLIGDRIYAQLVFGSDPTRNFTTLPATGTILSTIALNGIETPSPCIYATTTAPWCDDQRIIPLFGYPKEGRCIGSGAWLLQDVNEMFLSGIENQITRIYYTSHLADHEWQELSATERWNLLEFSIFSQTNNYRTCPFCVRLHMPCDLFDKLPPLYNFWNVDSDAIYEVNWIDGEPVGPLSCPNDSDGKGSSLSDSEDSDDDDDNAFYDVPVLENMGSPATGKSESPRPPSAPINITGKSRCKKAGTGNKPGRPRGSGQPKADGTRIIRPKSQAKRRSTLEEMEAANALLEQRLLEARAEKKRINSNIMSILPAAKHRK
jgi:hypothetical protein